MDSNPFKVICPFHGPGDICHYSFEEFFANADLEEDVCLCSALVRPQPKNTLQMCGGVFLEIKGEWLMADFNAGEVTTPEQWNDAIKAFREIHIPELHWEFLLDRFTNWEL